MWPLHLGPGQHPASCGLLVASAMAVVRGTNGSLRADGVGTLSSPTFSPSALPAGDSTCSACRGLAAPPHPQDKEAASTPRAPPSPQDSTPEGACVSLPLLPHQEEAQGAVGSHPQETSWVGPQAGQAPDIPLKDSLNHLNLPPLLVLPTRWPPILRPDGHGAPDKLCRTEGTPRTTGAFECGHCHKPYHTLAGLARHQQLHCHLQAGRAFTCRYCSKEYASLGALKMHIRTHTLPCVCKLCGKAFSRPWLLQGHVRTHTGRKSGLQPGRSAGGGGL